MRGIGATAVLLCAAMLGGCTDLGYGGGVTTSPYGAYGGYTPRYGYGYGYGPFYDPYPPYTFGYLGGGTRQFHHRHHEFRHHRPPVTAVNPSPAPMPRAAPPAAPAPQPNAGTAARNQQLLRDLGVR